MKKSTLGGASGVRYICSPTQESDADNGESRVEVDDALVDADQTESGLVLGRDTGGLESNMTEVRPSPSRWSRTEELRLALHDLSPVKDLVSRISKSRGAQPLSSATETSSAALSSAPGSRGSPQQCSPVSATADTDRRTLINKMTTKISRAVGDKLNDLRSDRSQSRYCQSSAFPPLAESLSEEDVLQALSQTADSEERARQSDEDVASTTADELLVAPDVGFRSVATPIVTAADSASVTPATGSARRDFSLSGIRPLITNRLQRRTRFAPLSTPSSPSIPSSPSAPAVSSQFAISLSALQNKYGAGGQKVEGQAVEQDEPAEEALSLLDPQQLQLHYQQRQQQLLHSGTVSSPPAAAASGGAAVSCFWARLKRWLQASVRWWRCWWLVAVVAVLVAAPLGDLWRGLWLGAVMATVGSWTLFVRLGLGGRQRAQCHCALPPRAPDPHPPLSVYTAAVGCKGWMHELVSGPYSYHAAHHKTAPVYVCIENDLLRIKTFKGHLSRRAVWKECLPSVPFGEQRIFDISGAAIELLPHHLHVSKKWSRRYPLCVRLPQPTAKLGSRVSLVSTVSAGPSDSNSAAVSADDKFTAARGQTAEVKLYLFARTDRDKEDWFRCLSAAAKTPSPLISPSPSPVALDADNAPASPAPTPSRPALDFDCYMMHLMPSTNQVADASHVSWFNALIGRLAFDLIGDQGVCSFVQRLVQKKLSRVKLPYFIDELRVLSCELGCAAPRLSAVERVYCDERGLWLQLPMQYAGGASVTLVSRLNLLRLTQLDQQQPAPVGGELSGDRPATAGTESEAQLDTATATTSGSTAASSRHCRRHEPSDLDTSDSSSDEDSVSSCHHPGVGEQGEESKDGADAPSAQVGSRLLRVVDRVTSSRYFKQAAQISYVKKAMVDVSNTPIELSVHLLQLNGTLCINVPRPPADRLWYGFLHEPCIQISAQPRYGTRDVTTGHVTERIESSLVHELKKLLTLPNMDDLLLSYLHTETGS